MSMRFRAAAVVLLAAGGGSALAEELQVGVTSAPSVEFGVSGLEWRGASLSFEGSNRAVGAAVRRSLDFSVAGTAAVEGRAAYAFGRGARLGVGARGTLGPVAANAGLSVWSAPLGAFDPLAPWSLRARDVSEAGWSLDAGGRYRVRRDLVAFADAELGAQPNVAGGVEWRGGDVTWRGGARVGDGVAGLLVGADWRRDALRLSADALLGSGASLSASLNYADPLSVPSDLQLYAAYEPWRANTPAFRAGSVLSADIGPGVLSTELRGGTGGAGARVSYRLPLGGE